MVRRFIRAYFVVFAWFALAGIEPLRGQSFLSLRLGNSSYSDDPFCLESTAFFTIQAVEFDSRYFGVSLERNNSDWPWPDDEVEPPPGSTALFLSHGNAVSLAAHLNPLGFLRPSVNEYVRPFVGAGIHYSTDGDATAAPAGGAPTFGVRGQTRPYIVYGVNAFLPFGSGARFGATASYRRSSIFFGDFEFDTPQGTDVTTEGATLTSGTWAIGFAVRLGG